MIASLIISITTCLLIAISCIFLPSIKIKNYKLNLYWVIALIGALVILCSNLVSFKEFFSSLTKEGGINPIQILILFISMSGLSIYLDELGLFSYLASITLKICKDKQIKIFVAFYLLVAVLTMFTSNDIVILALTPFIIFFTKRAKISPIPYLVSEFTCANTWSMMFIIGNPTNIYIASSYNIAFIDYFIKMWSPTLVAGLLEFIILFLLFYKKLKEPISHLEEEIIVPNKPLTIIGVIILILCTISLVISSYIDIPMYLISLISFIVLSIIVLIYSLFKKRKPLPLLNTYKRLPYELIPFLLSMFVIVLALTKYGIADKLNEFLGSVNTNLTYGYSSLIMANLINNIPMSVLYSSTIEGLENTILTKAIYGSIIGSNIGAFITPNGALAGIMWMSILKKYDVKYSYLDFMKYGLIIGIPVSTVALLLI